MKYAINTYSQLGRKGTAMLAKLMLTLALAVTVLGGGAAFAAAPSERRVVDLAGRGIAVPAKVERLILGEGRAVAALAILDRAAPLARLVGTMGDFPLLDPIGHRKWLKRFPRLGQVAAIGKVAAASFSVEQAIALKPDLAVFSMAGHGPAPKDTEIVRQLEAAGVTVVFLDFFFDPLVNTPKSIALLGTLLGREAEAAEFVDAYQRHLRRVTDRLDGERSRPLVFIENRVGLQDECCATIGDGVLGAMVTAAGGRNLASGLLPGYAGTISLEYLMTHQPDIYLGTAVGNVDTAASAPGRIVLGHDTPPALAGDSLSRALRRPGIAQLDAVRQGRAHALWHHFVHSPFNVVAVQVMAKWFHPALFADLDPAATLRELTGRFQPVPLDGVFWTDPS